MALVEAAIHSMVAQTFMLHPFCLAIVEDVPIRTVIESTDIGLEISYDVRPYLLVSSGD